MEALSSFLAILPEVLTLVLAGIVLAMDAVWSDERRRSLGWLTAGGLALVMVLSMLYALPGSAPALAVGGMVRHDWMAFIFKMIFLFGAAVTALFGMDSPGLGKRGEFYVLLLVATVGMNFMASAADLIMLYLAIETTSIPLYVLAGFLRSDRKSTEAGFKYLLFGAMTSAIMLYGFTLLFGFTGVTSLEAIALKLYAVGAPPLAAVLGSMMLILVGFGFKVSVVPFHFWAPDVYEGAPTPVAGYLSTASKAAGFAVLLNFMLVVFPGLTGQWAAIMAALAVASMTLGNLAALTQKNLKRMLAYSSIAHAGYMIIGFVALSELGMASVVFYLMAYLLTNLAAFGAAVAFGKVAGSDEISAYAGLSRRSPWLAMSMLISFLSLAGMPPFGGFVAKVFVFAAAVDAGWIWLAIVGVLNSIFGLYYYLTVLKVVYLYRSEDDDKPLPISRPYALALFVLSLGILLVGAFFGPWYELATTAAAGLF